MNQIKKIERVSNLEEFYQNPNQMTCLRDYINIHTWKSKRKRHRLLAEATKDSEKVTLNREYLRNVSFFYDTHNTMPLHQKSQTGNTFFKEVLVAPPQMSKLVKQYVQTKVKPVKNPWKKLMQIIERDWNSDHFHLQLHSSGYDSRIISGILMKLREKHGEGWIGDVLFLCWEPEGIHFKKQMEWQGWNRNQYHVYREGIGLDYRSELVDFENVWRWVNDYSIPHLCAGPAIEDAIKTGLAPKNRDIYVVMGISPSIYHIPEKQEKPRVRYTNKNANGFLAERERQSLWAMFLGMPSKEIYAPFFDIKVLAAMIKHKARVELLKANMPELCSLKRYPQRHGYMQQHHNWLNEPAGLSEKTRREAAENYNSSHLVIETKQPQIDISPDLNHGLTEKQQGWWRNYVLASTCEYLINQGVKIDVNM